MKAYRKKSLLFPNVPPKLLKKLRNQYRSDKGKEKNEYKKNKELRQDCVTRLVAEKTLETCFESVIVDEAHFHKNGKKETWLVVLYTPFISFLTSVHQLFNLKFSHSGGLALLS